MIVMQGKGVSTGVMKGPLYFFQRQDTTVVKMCVEDTEAEKARLTQAQEKAIAQLEALAERCREEAGYVRRGRGLCGMHPHLFGGRELQR